MDRAEPDEEMRARREVLGDAGGERGRREQRISERGHCAGRPDEHHRAQRAAHGKDHRALSAEAQRAAARRPPRRDGGRAEEQERVDEMQADAQRALHRCVVRDQLEENEAGADERLGHHEERGRPRATAHPVPAGVGANRQSEEHQRADHRAAARQAVRELDERLDAVRARDDLAVARGPVAAAAGAGPARPNVGPPGDHQHLVTEEGPGEPCRRARGRRRHRGSPGRGRHRDRRQGAPFWIIGDHRAGSSRRAGDHPARPVPLHADYMRSRRRRQRPPEFGEFASMALRRC